MQKTKTKHKHNEHLNIKMRIASSGHLVWVDIWQEINKQINQILTLYLTATSQRGFICLYMRLLL